MSTVNGNGAKASTAKALRFAAFIRVSTERQEKEGESLRTQRAQIGRAVDSLPTGPEELRSLASSLGFDRASELREEYRRVTRRARKVFETRFYD